MAPEKGKNSKKELSFEHYARAIQTDIARLGKSMEGGFKSIREDMATKADLWPMQRDIKTLDTNLRTVRDDVKMITDSMVSKADLANTLAEELAKAPYIKQIEDLRTRVTALESKLGNKPARRVA
jgi:hypothetical protein